MIGFVMVSHSEPLARAAVDLALQMVHGDRPPIRIASGAAGGFGTDAAAIAAAIDELADADGVLILTDLGSAVMSSEFALDLRTSTQPVRISDGPFVEGATAAIVRAATGGTLDEVAGDARRALDAKRIDDGMDAGAAGGAVPGGGGAASGAGGAASGAGVALAVDPAPGASAEETLVNPLGIHSRPAALIVKTANGYDADVEITNATAGKGPVKANSLIGLLSIGATKGDLVRLQADGPDAEAAVAALAALVRDGFGELDA